MKKDTLNTTLSSHLAIISDLQNRVSRMTLDLIQIKHDISKLYLDTVILQREIKDKI